MKNLLFILCFCNSPFLLQAQTATKKQHKIESKVFGTSRTLTVYTPPSYHYSGQADKQYQVIYVFGDQVEQTADLLAATNTYLAADRVTASYIIVAVHTNETTEVLTEELIPKWQLPPPPEEAVSNDNAFAQKGPFRPIGRAHLLDQYLAEEVFPWIESTYRTYSYRLALGTGIGGAYALYDWSQPVSLFQGYIVLNLLFWYQKATLYEQLTRELEANQELSTVLYFAAGSTDKEEESVKENMVDLEQVLSKAVSPHLHYHFQPFEFIGGQRAVVKYLGEALLYHQQWLGNPNKERLGQMAQQSDFVKEVQQYYQERNKQLGYQQQPTDDDLIQLVLNAPSSLKDRQAIAVLDWAIILYPKSFSLYRMKASYVFLEQGVEPALKLHEKSLEVLEQQKNELSEEQYTRFYNTQQMSIKTLKEKLEK